MAAPKTKVPTTNGAKAVKMHAPKKLNIAAGQRPMEGFKGIDIAAGADIQHDLFEFPWPIKTNSVEEVWCAHFVEHVPHWRPGWDRDGWWLFFDELYRIMKAPVLGADEQITYSTAQFIHPYVKHERAFWDPTHVRFIEWMSWYYLDAQWRVAQGLDHYPVECDFEVVTINATGIADEYMTRNQEQQNYARNHYWNVVPDLQVILKRR